ncbi:MAG: hypothetical protein ACKVH8_12170 [Pirellulales bacterium]
MRLSILCTLALLLVVALPWQPVHADVGNCCVMFVYNPKLQMDAKQQKEIGNRLMDAHVGSSYSDGHILFVCFLDTNKYRETGVLYRIRETYADFGHHLKGYRLSSPDFNGLRLAVSEVEMASKDNSISSLKAGARKKVLSAPLYKNDD